MSENSNQSKFELMHVAQPVSLAAVKILKIFGNLNTSLLNMYLLLFLHSGHLTLTPPEELLIFNMVCITVMKCITTHKQLSEMVVL